MNPLDLVIATILGFTLIRGIFRGLVKELSSIVGVLAGFYAAYTYYDTLARFLSQWVSAEGTYLNIVSFLALFCGVFILISILGVVIKYLLNIVYLGWADRMGGAGFGVLKGVLIGSVLLVMLTAFLPSGAPLVKESLLAPHVLMISEQLIRVVPQDLKHKFSEKLKEHRKSWTSQTQPKRQT